MSARATADERRRSGIELSHGAGPRFGTTLLGLYVAPREAFARVLAARSFWLPLGLLVALNVAFSAWWVPRADIRGMYRAALEEQGLWSQIDAAQRERVLAEDEAAFPYVTYSTAVVGAPIVVLALSLFFFPIYRFLYRSGVTLRDCLVVTTWTLLAVALVRTPASVMALLLKGDWTLNPQQALDVSPAALFGPADLSPALAALLAGFDPFLLWTLLLLAVGFGVAVRRPMTSAAWGIVIPYGVILLAFIGLRATSGGGP